MAGPAGADPVQRYRKRRPEIVYERSNGRWVRYVRQRICFDDRKPELTLRVLFDTN